MKENSLFPGPTPGGDQDDKRQGGLVDGAADRHDVVAGRVDIPRKDVGLQHRIARTQTKVSCYHAVLLLLGWTGGEADPSVSQRGCHVPELLFLCGAQCI